MMKFWEKLESKSSYHYPNSWWVRGRLVLNTCHLKKIGRAHEDQMKPRTSELFDSKTLKQFNLNRNICNIYNVDKNKTYRIAIGGLVTCISLCLYICHVTINNNNATPPFSSKPSRRFRYRIDKICEGTYLSLDYWPSSRALPGRRECCRPRTVAGSSPWRGLPSPSAGSM